MCAILDAATRAAEGEKLMDFVLGILVILSVIVIALPWVSLINLGTIAKELTAIRRLMEELKK